MGPSKDGNTTLIHTYPPSANTFYDDFFASSGARQDKMPDKETPESYITIITVEAGQALVMSL